MGSHFAVAVLVNVVKNLFAYAYHSINRPSAHKNERKKSEKIQSKKDKKNVLRVPVCAGAQNGEKYKISGDEIKWNVWQCIRFFSLSWMAWTQQNNLNSKE